MKEIARDQLKQLIDEKADYVLVDVREPDELATYGKIPTAKNVPLSEFKEALGLSEEEFEEKYKFKLTKKDRVIFYCRSGGRSLQAAEYAEQCGFDVTNYKGSILDWSEIDPNVKAY